MQFNPKGIIQKSKLMDKKINRFQNFINIIKNVEINSKSPKLKKHTPYSKSRLNIEDNSINQKDRCIEIKFNNGTKIWRYLDEQSLDFEEQSYSLSELSAEEHKKYIIDTVSENISLLKFFYGRQLKTFSDEKKHMNRFGKDLYDNINSIINLKIFDENTDNINKLMNTSYTSAYYVDIIPPLSFIQNRKNNNCIIANRYIVAIGKDTKNNVKLNIFFSYEPSLVNTCGKYGRKGLLDYINEKNKKNSTFDELPELINNLKNICQHFQHISLSVLDDNNNKVSVTSSESIPIHHKLIQLINNKNFIEHSL